MEVKQGMAWSLKKHTDMGMGDAVTKSSVSGMRLAGVRDLLSQRDFRLTANKNVCIRHVN